MSQISKETFRYLLDLRANNHRDWFMENKPRYEASHRDMISFAEDLFDRFSESDNLVPMTGKKILFRIYRDVRFSKDKTPYKTYWSGSFKRATKLLRGGYYFHVSPEGGSFVGGGFWGPNKEDLKRIRDEFAVDADPMREIIASKSFQKYFGELKGDKVKTAPKGYPKDHPNIDLIRHKSFVVSRAFTDEEVLSSDFMEEIALTFEAMRPYFDYMSDVLTTNADGEVDV